MVKGGPRYLSLIALIVLVSAALYSVPAGGLSSLNVENLGFQYSQNSGPSASSNQLQSQASTTSARSDLNEDLEAYFHFDNIQVSRGYSLNFDGSNDYVRINDSDNSPLDVDYLTISAWVRTGGSSTGNMVLNKESTYELSAGTDGVSMAVQAKNCGGWCSGWAIEDAGNVSSNKWAHVAGTWNGSHMKVYINGSQVGSYQKANAGPIDNTNRDLGIGARDVDSSVSANFVGKMDDPKVLSRSLDQSEINAIYQGTFQKNQLPSSCSDIPEGAKSGYYKIDPNGGSMSDAFKVYCDVKSGKKWMKLWFKSDKSDGYGFVACESSKWNGEWSSSPLEDIDPNCDQGLNETIYNLDYYSDGGTKIGSSQLSRLSDSNAVTAYSGAFHFYDADDNCDSGREPVTDYNNSGPSGNALNVFPTRGDPANDTTHVICGGGNNNEDQVVNITWQKIMDGGIPTGLGLQSGSGDTGCWNCSGFSPGYGSTIEFKQTFFWTRSPDTKREVVLEFNFDGREDCKINITEPCLDGQSLYGLNGTPYNFDDNTLSTGSGWNKDTPINRPSVEDSSNNSHQGFIYEGRNGVLNNFTFDASSGWTSSSKVGDYALRFEGNNDFVEVDNLVDNRKKVTVGAWVKLEDKSSDRALVGEWGKTDNSHLLWYDVGTDRFRVTYNGQSTGPQVTSSTSPSTSEWYFVSWTREPNSETLNIFVNGALEDTTSATEKISSGPPVMGIGGDYNSHPNMDGSIDDVVLYDRALSEGEMKDLYNGDVLLEGLMARWNFESGNRRTAYDTSIIAPGLFDTTAVSFNQSSYMELGYIPTTGNFSVSFWVSENLNSRWHGVVDKGRNRDPRDWYFLTPNGNCGSPYGSIFRAGSEAGEIDSCWGADSWHHVTGVWSTVNGGTQKLYVDGKLRSTAEGPRYTSQGYGIELGRRNDGSNYMKGSIDELRVYNRTLEKAEIESLVLTEIS